MSTDMFTTPSWLLYVACFFVVYFVACRLEQRGEADSNSLRNLVIAGGSIWLYALSSVPAALILLGFCVAIYLYSQQSPLSRAVSAPIWIVVALGYLGFVKYWNFIADQLGFPFKHHFYVIGISFYVFTLVGYLVDTAYRRHKPLTKFSHLIILLGFWPHLAAGPILRLENIRSHIERKQPLTVAHLRLAIMLMVGGLAKKFFLADNLGTYVNANIEVGVSKMNGLEALSTLLGFTGQIYFDFSGYSDIAIGAATLIGFRLPANFNHPYRATSLADFWQRWHISLSTWFRDYLYIPLGGNRRGNLYLNLLTVFAISGLWHGAATGFVIWGLIHGSFLCIERYFARFFRRVPNFGRRVITLAVVIFAWAFFRVDTASAQLLLQKIFKLKSYSDYTRNSQFYVLPFVPLVIFLLIDQLFPYYRVGEDGFISTDVRKRDLAYGFLLFILMLFFSSSGLPFIYFQF